MLNYQKIYVNTFQPQIPVIINQNFQNIVDYINIFYDPSILGPGGVGTLRVPLTTTGLVKATTGEFLNLLVKNHTVIQGDLFVLGSIHGDIAGTEVNAYNILIDPCDAGIFSYKTDTSAGTSLYFKSIRGSSGVIVTNASDYILINADVSTFGDNIFLKEASLGNKFVWNSSGYLDVSVSGGSGNYYTTLDPSLTMPVTVGGYPAGTTVYDLLGDSFITMFDNLLFPTVYPTYVAPSLSFSVTPNTLQEVSANVPLTFTSTFNRGQILINGNFQNYRSGLPITYDYSGTGLVDVSSSLLSNTQSLATYYVKIGNQPPWTSSVLYSTGPQPYDNKGNPYGSPLSSGSVGPQSLTFEGVYPIFATTVDITTLTKQTLVSMLYGNNITMTMVAETGGNKQKFEIPTAWTGSPTNRPLVGVQQYNTVSSQWEYPGGSAATSLLLWTTSSVTKNIQGYTTNYTRYTYNGVDRSSVQIRLVF